MFSKDQIKLAIAPIAWTNDDLPELGGHIPFEQCIDEMAEAGFPEVKSATNILKIQQS